MFIYKQIISHVTEQINSSFRCPHSLLIVKKREVVRAIRVFRPAISGQEIEMIPPPYHKKILPRKYFRDGGIILPLKNRQLSTLSA
jgi:hypothetical protein